MRGKAREIGGNMQWQKNQKKSSEINFARKFVYYAPTSDKEVSSSLDREAGQRVRGAESNFIESPLCAAKFIIFLAVYAVVARLCHVRQTDRQTERQTGSWQGVWRGVLQTLWELPFVFGCTLHSRHGLKGSRK